MLSEEALAAFKKLYIEEFGEEISDEEATELGVSLLSLFNQIYRPVKKEWLEENGNKEEVVCVQNKPD